jgi:TolB-like protein/Tfp pilus assembly protein PilF
MKPPAPHFFLVERFRFDRRGSGLFRLDDGSRVAIGSRAVGILGELIERAGDVVSKDEIIKAVWPETIVGDGNLTVQISALRRVLDDGQLGASAIQTIPGRGYRFIGEVTRPEVNAESGGSTIVGRGARVSSRLSIVVLPMINLNSDPEQEYFVDAMTEDLTTDLSRLAGSFVISCNTAFTYKGRPVNSKQIAQELGVRYVVEGSVQRSGDRVRINTQLIDAETDAHLWAERFVGDTGDLFALQDDITSRIAIALELELIAAEATRPTESPDALDYIFRGRAAMFNGLTRDNWAAAISWYERALVVDPKSVEGQSRLANALASRVIDQMTDSAASDVARAEGLVRQALAASDRNPLAHFAKGAVLRAQYRFDEAIPQYEIVIACNRNSVGALGHIGWCKFWTGSIEEAIQLQEQAIRRSPRDPAIANWYFRTGLGHLLLSRTDEAILWLEKARSASGTHPNTRAALASAYALKGNLEQAVAELTEARRLFGSDRLSNIARLKAVGFFGTSGYFGAPKVISLFEGTYFIGLRNAGVREK